MSDSNEEDRERGSRAWHERELRRYVDQDGEPPPFRLVRDQLREAFGKLQSTCGIEDMLKAADSVLWGKDTADLADNEAYWRGRRDMQAEMEQAASHAENSEAAEMTRAVTLTNREWDFVIAVVEQTAVDMTKSAAENELADLPQTSLLRAASRFAYAAKSMATQLGWTKRVRLTLRGREVSL